MTATTPGREVDAATVHTLKLSYAELARFGADSVRAAWRFGQCLDSFTDTYTRRQLADAMDVSVSTIMRYLKLHAAYQRPELAVAASEALETYNIDIITELHDQLGPVEHARPYAGRRYRYRCTHCHQVGMAREEYDPDSGLTINPDTGRVEPGTGVVAAVKFAAPLRERVDA